MDVHQYVRGELEIAKQQLSTQAESHQRYVTKRILTATLAILGVLGLGNLAAWWGGANYLKTRTQEAIDQSASAVRQRINQEFATPRIHAIVTEVATNEAQELLQRKVQPEVDKLRADTAKRLALGGAEITDRLASFKSGMNAAEQRYTADHTELVATLEAQTKEAARLTQSLTDQVSQLAKRNELTELADKAILGDSAAYQVLKRLDTDPNPPQDYRHAVRAEIFRVKTSHLIGSRTVAFELHFQGKPVDVTEVTTCHLITTLADSQDWSARAMVARELGKRKERGVPEALIRALDDKNLSVVKEAVRAWRTLTSYRSPDIFGRPYIPHWWEQHKGSFTQQLAELRCKDIQ